MAGLEAGMTRTLMSDNGLLGRRLRDAVMLGATVFDDGGFVRLGRGLSTGWMH